MPVTTLELIRETRALLTPDGAWMQGAYNNSPTNPSEATCFCLSGALHHVHGPHNYDGRCTHLVVQRYIQMPIPSWNDEPGRTQSEILSLLDKVEADLVEKARLSEYR